MTGVQTCALPISTQGILTSSLEEAGNMQALHASSCPCWRGTPLTHTCATRPPTGWGLPLKRLLQKAKEAQGSEAPTLKGLEDPGGEELGNFFPAEEKGIKAGGGGWRVVGVGGITDQLPVRLRGLGREGGPGRRGHGKRCPWGTATCLPAGDVAGHGHWGQCGCSQST